MSCNRIRGAAGAFTVAVAVAVARGTQAGSGGGGGGGGRGGRGGRGQGKGPATPAEPEEEEEEEEEGAAGGGAAAQRVLLVPPAGLRHPALRAGSLRALLRPPRRPGRRRAPGLAPDHPLAEKLSPRELQVLKGLTEAKSNKEIARDLDITEPTVKLHMKTLYRKVGAANRTQAALIARESGLF